MKVCIVTLGCKVNTYESEVMKSKFLQNHDIIVSLKEKPDLVVINTCTVTNSADAKSRKIIRQAKKINPGAIIAVCGCSAQHHQKDLQSLGIDILIGNQDKSKIVNYVNEHLRTNKNIVKFYDLNQSSFENMQITNYLERTRAFVKIQDGCNNYCSYCIIPYIRGQVRNKDLNAAITEITLLVKKGFKEIVLTGIHTGSYGLGTNYNLVTLINQISSLTNLKRLRISSIEITEITDAFLNELKNNPKVCDHLHIPLQSGSNAILKAMNRKYDTKKYQEIINKIRKIRPDINITTDIIVGFPTETKEDFANTINVAKAIGFGKIHVFPYSKRTGTIAANLKNIVTDNEKKQRTKALLDLSDVLEQSYNQRFINQKLNVLIEEVKNNESIGHTSNYLRVQLPQKLEHNEEYPCLIIVVDKNNVKGKCI